jgi:hypothetical protein
VYLCGVFLANLSTVRSSAFPLLLQLPQFLVPTLHRPLPAAPASAQLSSDPSLCALVIAAAPARAAAGGLATTINFATGSGGTLPQAAASRSCTWHI